MGARTLLAETMNYGGLPVARATHYTLALETRGL